MGDGYETLSPLSDLGGSRHGLYCQFADSNGWQARVVASLAPLVGTGDSGDFGQCNREEAPVDATLLLAIASHIRKLELRADTDSGAVSPATCGEAATSSAAQADCLPSTTSFLRPTQSPSAEPSWCEAMGEGQAL